MNVFIVLIPMLLMSAVFIEIRVIEMSQPPAAAARPSRPASAPLELSLHVRGDTYVVTGNGIAPMTFARPAAPGAGGALDTTTTASSSPQALAQVVAAHPENKEIRIVAEAGTHYQEIVVAHGSRARRRACRSRARGLASRKEPDMSRNADAGVAGPPGSTGAPASA